MTVLAYHVIFGAYGFWLPNDPRGSWSSFVGSWELFRYGGATKTDTTRSVARVEHDRNMRLRAKKNLKYPAVRFSSGQIRAIANGFQKAKAENGYIIHACAILPDHVHVVARRHKRRIEKVVAHLKSKASRSLTSSGLRTGKAPVWARGSWHVYLNSRDDIIRSIKYVTNNPGREGRSPQKWEFVDSFDPNEY
ncbi:MAG: transposase [Planctomycetota bacterium]|jgi:REP element-mobilizing transposase RayT